MLQYSPGNLQKKKKEDMEGRRKQEGKKNREGHGERNDQLRGGQ